MNIRILGIEISRKTDILAFAAFLLSLSTVVVQTIVFFAGPEVTFDKPRQVVILMASTSDTKERYLTLVSSLAYVNRGKIGKNAVVMREQVSFSFEEETYHYIWKQFGTLEFPTDSRKIKFVQSRVAAPFVVPARGAEAHETLFTPRRHENFIYQEAITRVFESVRRGKDYIWKVHFHIEILNDKDQTEECQVLITPRLANNIISKELGFAALNCK